MMRITWRLLTLIAPFRWWIALALLLGFATIGSGVGLAATSAYLIAKAALAPSIAELQLAIVGVRFFGIARGGFRYLERYVAHAATLRLLAGLRVWFYQAVEPLAPARLLHYRSGDLLGRVVADIETLEHFYVRVIAPPVVALLVAGLSCLLLGQFSLWLGVTLLAFLGLAGIGLPLLIRLLSRHPGAQFVAVRAELNATLVGGVQGVADILACGREDQYQADVQRLSDRLARAQERMAAIRGLNGALSGLLASLAGLALLSIAIPLVRSDQIDGVYLPLIALVALASFEAVTPLTQAAQHLDSSLAAARRLCEIVDSPPVVHDPSSGSPEPRHSGLEVRNLSFAYEPTAPLALDRVSFSVPPGGRLAIVGPSGAGKTTLLHLLLRFWDYEHGQIWLGGHELRRYRADDVRRMVSVVSQQVDLFTGTIRENLLIARPAAGEAALVAAAQQACIHEFIQGLPHAYDTWIGEQGLRLSGGERQRLAIARAILKGAPILILDEPTAQLDALAEREIMQSLTALMAGRTTLIITHRLAGLEDVDRILVLSAGRVVEQGRHPDLLLAGGLYRRMWDSRH